MTDIICITTTTETKEEAGNLARVLLDEKLIACAQITGPITSHYRWENDMMSSVEYSLAVKTTVDLYDRVEKTILREHPYELPEVLGDVVTVVSRAYREWVVEEVGP